MTESKDFISDFSFIFRKENGSLVSFNWQCIFFRLSIIEIKFF